MIKRPLETVGSRMLELARSAGKAALLVRSSVIWLVRSPLEGRQTLLQMLRIGVDSFMVTAMTSLFTGMVLALQTGASSKRLLNEPLFIGTIVSFSMVKELGPVMSALVVSGRAGAAIAAELGTMCVTEQIDALYTLGTNPVRYLVIPRVLAFLAVLPVLAIFSDYAGILGGCLVAKLKLGIPTSVYWHDVFDYLENKQFFHGLIKTYAFALCIAYISCYKGLTTTGGAEGVGKSTTSAVVMSMTVVLIVDYFVTAILVAVGIT